jgi:LysR family transcriptional activator of nhaA
MEWLNYHHLLYFWTVAREGGLVPAGKVLHLSHPTLSAQIHALEERLGEPLFVKEGRKRRLTDVGQTVFRYADEIFTVGQELLEAVKGSARGKPLRLDVGVADVVPKFIVRRLLQPALALPEAIHLFCHEDSHDKLLTRLASHELDLVLADAPVPPGSRVRAFSHLLGETSVSFLGSQELARVYRRGFPKSLNEAPMLLPLENLSLRRAIDQWFDQQSIKPRVIAEFEDSALLKVFGSDGVGIFPAPTAIEKEIIERYGVVRIGLAKEVRERFYAISGERRLKHPAVVAITETARGDLFARQP